MTQDLDFTELSTTDPDVVVNTVIGQDSQIDEELVLALLLDYQNAPKQSKQRTNAKRAIVTALLPAIDCVARRFGDYDRSDLFQDGVIKVIQMIDKWDSTKKGTIGGYIRRGLFNYYATQAGKQAKEIGTMNISQHEGLEERLEDLPLTGLDLNLLIEQLQKSRPAFLVANERDAYDHALQWFLDLSHDVESLRALTLEITRLYNVSTRRAAFLIAHARVSLRMQLDNRAPTIPYQRILTTTPKDSMFLRMIQWLNLDEDTVEDLVKIFGGIEITIPKGDLT